MLSFGHRACVVAGLAAVLSACASTSQTGARSSDFYADIPPPSPSTAASRYQIYDTGTPPRPALPSERIPPPSALTTPAYTVASRAEEEQRTTAERLSQWQRSGNGLSSMTSTGAVTQGLQPALIPVVQSSAPAYATTDYYAGASNIGAGALIPPMPQSARPGECYALVRTPEQYRSIQRDYVARPGYDGAQLTPARYQTALQDYTAQEAYERLEVIPATFRTVTEQVEITPPSTRYLASEPRYETVTEKVLEKPATQTWKRGRGPIQKIDNASGEIMCLVEEPAVYRTVTRKVIKTQPQMREVQLPGEYRTITRRVIDQPAQVRRVAVPEQRSTVQVQKLVAPAAYQMVRVPDQMASYTTRELAAPATLEWRPVLCETNIRDTTVRRVQDALRNAGFDPGPSDGRAGKRTLDALNAYQRAKGLPEDRYLNLPTLQALGVGLP
ncbi:MAG: putative peptidoglycan binding protein [Hydrocarboniphaga sp.]|uniref:peptidoglycan-binding domain-containing protein n=1 Tax=Hydrocarboniphaga sp. TaxID=2033016 RepID=UPI002607D031|nr:peptidoglycan-binding domain-containing protein [Hydrocarboniphaga sp.]MDB5968257.1 putative peptidoglycan binding protein [Hydrocarboniphaga sp.]